MFHNIIIANASRLSWYFVIFPNALTLKNLSLRVFKSFRIEWDRRTTATAADGGQIRPQH